ncbi:MAG: sulfite exporter TauE/SafE family protein, partial [Gammaproteobacteria bacterium]
MPAELSHLTAFLIGLLSTFHCWGMCGGIVGALSLAMPAAVRHSRRRELLMLACYNLGRIGSYGVAG